MYSVGWVQILTTSEDLKLYGCLNELQTEEEIKTSAKNLQ